MLWHSHRAFQALLDNAVDGEASALFPKKETAEQYEFNYATGQRWWRADGSATFISTEINEIETATLAKSNVSTHGSRSFYGSFPQRRDNIFILKCSPARKKWEQQRRWLHPNKKQRQWPSGVQWILDQLRFPETPLSLSESLPCGSCVDHVIQY